MESEHIILNSSRKLIFEIYDINNLDILLKLYNVVEYLSRRSRIPPRKVYKIIYIPVELYVEYKEHNNNDWIELQLNDRIFNYGDKTITFNFNDNKRYDLKIYGNTLRQIQDENLSKKFYKTLNDSGSTTITYTLLENNVNNVDNNDTTNNDTTNNDTTNNDTTTVVTDNTETDTNTDETTTPTTTSTVSEENSGGTLMNDSIEIDDYIYRFQIIKRQIGNTQLEEKLNNRDGVIYIINDSKSKDYGLKTSSLYVGDGKGFDYLSYDSIDGLNIKSKKVEIISDGGVVDIATKFKQTDNEMSLKVEKNDVVNQINLSNEGIKIDGSKILIDGETIFLDDTNFNGKIIGDDSLQVIDDDRGYMTEIKGGSIVFKEKDVNNRWVPVTKIRKFITDVYLLRDNVETWVDLRDYTSGIEWKGNIKINFSLVKLSNFYGMNSYEGILVRDENKHRFKFNLFRQTVEGDENKFTLSTFLTVNKFFNKGQAFPKTKILSIISSQLNFTCVVRNAYYSWTRKGSRHRNGRRNSYEVYGKVPVHLEVYYRKSNSDSNFKLLKRFTDIVSSCSYNFEPNINIPEKDIINYDIEIYVMGDRGFDYDENSNLRGHIKNDSGTVIELSYNSIKGIYKKEGYGAILWTAFEEEF